MALRCFVAMAFSRDDTNKLYEVIRRALRKIGVAPRRVDKLVFNANIDNKILNEIKACDFAIADLTYARPSVYFEAGYAERRTPVIYTCRKDHFTPQSTDPLGNLRVHFDLRMRNMISWRTPADGTFSKELAKRIRYIITPIQQESKKQEKAKQEIRAFGGLPVKEQKRRILALCEAQFEREGYRGTRLEVNSFSKWYPVAELLRFRDILLSHQPGWLGTKLVQDQLHAAFVHVTHNITLTQLRGLKRNLFDVPFYNLNQGTESTGLKKLVEHHFICCLQKVPLARVKASLSDYTANQECKELSYRTRQEISRGRIPEYSHIYVHHHGPLIGFFACNHVDKVTSFGDGSFYLTQVGVRYSRRVHLPKRSKSIDRQIYIHVFDAIRSESQIQKQIESSISH